MAHQSTAALYLSIELKREREKVSVLRGRIADLEGSNLALATESHDLQTNLAAVEADAARYLKALTAIDEQLSETEGCGEIDVLMGMIAREAIDAATQPEEP